MALICMQCLNEKLPQNEFIQISLQFRKEPFERLLTQASNGLHREKWIKHLQGFRQEGIYCARCGGKTAEEHITREEKQHLQDLRLETWGPGDFPLASSVELIEEIARKTGAGTTLYHQPAKDPVFAALDKPLHPLIQEKLSGFGIKQLYSHQAEAINCIGQGKNIVVTTSTSSGKSLIYTLPVLDLMLNDDSKTALYLSPLKALTFDQLQALQKWSDKKGEFWDGHGFQRLSIGEKTFGAGCLQGGNTSVNSHTYQEARYWMTNVHFLHMILRGPQTFKNSQQHMIAYFMNLKYVILDEVHAYEGVLGTKVGMLIRRLKNLCKYLGNQDLQFIVCSGTIGNPAELACEITGSNGNEKFICIDEDGSAQHEKEIILWNPGLLSSPTENRTRRAPLSEMAEIIRTLAEKGAKLPKILLFMEQKKTVNQTVMELNKIIPSSLGQHHNRQGQLKLFAPFHANLTGFQKQETMEQLKNNELMGVITTSALAMGIDIGDLNICIMIGYPGSKANFLQQAGRVGRRGPGIVILIFRENPLEQYFASNPEEFMLREPEQVSIDVKNPAILYEHLQYAAFETGGKIRSPHSLFKVSSAKKHPSFQKAFFEPEKGIIALQNQEVLYVPIIKSGIQFTVYHISGYSRTELYSNIDERQMLRDYHVKAVFLHNDQTFKVTRVLYGKGEVHAVSVRTDYTTRSKISDTLAIEIEESIQEVNGIQAGTGRAEATRHLWGFVRHYFSAGGSPENNLEESPMRPVKYQTDAFWLCLPKDAPVNDAALHATEHAIASAIPMIVKCSLSDIAHHSGRNLKNFPGTSTIVIFESGGGGAGICKLVQARLPYILQKARQILESCKCRKGCPNCTHLSYCEKENSDIDKSGALQLLEYLNLETGVI